MTGRTALIAGATGLVGGHCLRLLLRESAYTRVLAVGRRKAPLEDAKLRQEVVDFATLATGAGSLAADDVYCCLGTTLQQAGGQAAFRKVDFDAVLALAKAARERGAARFFLVSSLGADARSSLFYSRVKGEIEAAVAALPFEAVFILRPSLLLGDRGEFRLK